ncbi:14586_t:CDS:2 [Rhizophagus irregularis]|nr:14586_t:CDS:2 [Rhizophagus irregularis]
MKNLGGRSKSLVWRTYAKQGEQESDSHYEATCDNLIEEKENIQDIVISENESSIEWDPDIEADKIIDDM